MEHREVVDLLEKKEMTAGSRSSVAEGEGRGGCRAGLVGPCGLGRLRRERGGKGWHWAAPAGLKEEGEKIEPKGYFLFRK